MKKPAFDKLKIGANEKPPGFVTVDIDPATKPDFVGDVQDMKCFRDNSFSYVMCDSVLEHVPDMLAAMKEIHRVSRNGGIIEIWMPHFSSAQTWMHLQHKRGGSYFMFDRQRCGEYGFVVEVLDRRILVEGRRYPQHKMTRCRWTPFMKFIEWLVNKKPMLFERLLCYWLGGADALYFRLKVVK